MTRLILVSTLALLAVGGAGTASAEKAPTVRVGYADLDLTRPADVVRLRRRSELAVREVCGDAGWESLAMRAFTLRCRAAARGGAAVQMAQAVDRSVRRAALDHAATLATR